MNSQSNGRSERYFLHLLMAISAVLAFVLVKELLGIVVLSVFMAILFRPLYLQYLKRLKGKQGFAVPLTIITIFVVIVVPVTIVILMTIKQGGELASDIGDWAAAQKGAEPLTVERLNQVLAEIPATQDLVITGEGIARVAVKGVTTMVGWLAAQVSSLATSIPRFFMDVMLFIGIVSALLSGWPALMQNVRTLSPLRNEWDQLYISTLEALIKSMVIAALVSVTLQGTLMTFFLWLAGVPYLFFWFLLSCALAITPTGCSLVAFPVGIILILLGQTAEGLIVILGYIIVVANVSPVVNPKIMHGKTHLNQALLMIALFGGLLVFGLVGVFYGPILLAFIMTTLHVYFQYFRGSNPPQEATADSAPGPIGAAQSG